jgi:hypothetical protein
VKGANSILALRRSTFMAALRTTRFEGPSLISRIVTQNQATRLRCSILLMTQVE